MRVLLTGASGFLGSRIASALASAGHEVVCVSRQPPAPAGGDTCRRWVQGDFMRDLDAADWRERVAGIDVVINAAGILRERPGARFDRLHVQAPRALFEACVQAGVRRVVQVSALGADAGARSGYHRTKKAADDLLLGLPLDAVVVQPSLVWGPGGASARWFNLLASLPLIPLPGRGGQQVQPVHVDDAVQAIVRLAASDAMSKRRVALVGPHALSLRGLLAQLRRGLGLPAARFMGVPMPVVRAMALLTGRWPGALLDVETLGMLERGNCAAADDIAALLGRAPRPVSAFIAPAQAADLRTRARLDWLLPLLRGSVAAVWIVTGLLSLGLYPVQGSYALLARVGATGMVASMLLYGAAAVDLAFGVASLLLRRRWVWLLQMATIVIYTALITWRLPEFWLHPFGPILKNLPMLAAIGMLCAFEER